MQKDNLKNSVKAPSRALNRPNQRFSPTITMSNYGNEPTNYDHVTWKLASSCDAITAEQGLHH